MSIILTICIIGTFLISAASLYLKLRHGVLEPFDHSLRLWWHTSGKYIRKSWLLVPVVILALVWMGIALAAEDGGKCGITHVSPAPDFSHVAIRSLWCGPVDTELTAANACSALSGQEWELGHAAKYEEAAVWYICGLQ